MDPTLDFEAQLDADIERRRLERQAARHADYIAKHPYPHFARALLDIAPTSPELGDALGLTQRSAYNYLRGVRLPPIEVVKRFPVLDAALSADFAERAAAQSSTGVV